MGQSGTFLVLSGPHSSVLLCFERKLLSVWDGLGEILMQAVVGSSGSLLREKFAQKGELHTGITTWCIHRFVYSFIILVYLFFFLFCCYVKLFLSKTMSFALCFLNLLPGSRGGVSE